jgi:hypothetical protein
MEANDQHTVSVYFHENKSNLFANAQNKIYETVVYSQLTVHSTKEHITIILCD